MHNNIKYFFIESKDKYYYFIMVNVWYFFTCLESMQSYHIICYW